MKTNKNLKNKIFAAIAISTVALNSFAMGASASASFFGNIANSLSNAKSYVSSFFTRGNANQTNDNTQNVEEVVENILKENETVVPENVTMNETVLNTTNNEIIVIEDDDSDVKDVEKDEKKEEESKPKKANSESYFSKARKNVQDFFKNLNPIEKLNFLKNLKGQK